MTSTEIDTTDGALPAVPDDLMVGLEDVDETDVVMPRLKIIQDEAVFEDNLTNERFESIDDAIILGVVKQRILWPAEQGDGDGPLCKSNDHDLGVPNAAEFPWAESGFTNEGQDELSCQGCELKEWGTHPTRDMPWCADQHTYPILMRAGDQYAPAILTLQRSGLAPSKKYLSAFQRAKSPLFTVHTTIGLEPQRRGGVKYAKPVFVKGEPTDQEDWPEFADSYRTIRAFLSMARKLDGDTAVEVTAKPAAKAEASDSDEDLPWDD